MRHALRLAWLALFAAMLGTLSAPGTTLAYSLTTWSWNEPITLKLVDGRQLEGRYRGVSGRVSDADSYADLYAKWRAEHGADAVPALGDTLLVTPAAGEPLRGPLRGFTNKRLAPLGYAAHAEGDRVTLLKGGARVLALSETLAYVTLHAPSFTLRGGTREILRGIIARGLGLR